MITFGVLGTLTVHRDGHRVALHAPLVRRLLAVLICRNGAVVSASELADEIWDGAAPASGRKSLQVYVHRLRQAIGEPERIGHEAGGYWLGVDPAEVDSLRFADLVEQARTASREHRLDRASELYRRALGLWRGEPYADVPAGPIVAGEVRVLAEQCLRAQQESIAVELDRGRHAEQIAEMVRLTELYPFQEQLRAGFMLALYRCGRRAEALAVFRDTRALLVDQLGVEPGEPLQRLHEAILRSDTRLDHMTVEDLQHLGDQPRQPSPAVHVNPAPAQLPPDTASFIGRTDELRRLDALLPGQASDVPTAVVISAIGGAAGIGKTTLAVHWAHRVADQFPDGQLYVNLRGFDAASRPVHPAEAIRGFLDAFAIPAEHLPASLAAQTCLYRSSLAGRRVLVVLDNASDAEQVRPLLPGSAGCLVLVTSRNQLSGLVSAEGAQPLTLGLLADAEARDLLARWLGADRVAAQPEAVDQIIECCAGLPLALSVVAARGATNPEFSLAALAAELRDAEGLDALAGEGPSDIRSVFSWSYHKLSPDAARVFRLLSAHPGPQFSVHATASLVGGEVRQVRPLLVELSHAHLLAEPSPGRYAFHDLLRTYAGELAQAHDGETECRAALGRLLDHYLHTAYRADRLLYPHRYPLVLTPPHPRVSCPVLDDLQQALAWFATEHRVLLAVIEYAAGNGFERHAWQTTWSASTFLGRCGHWQDEVAVYEIALDGARRLGDTVAESHVCFGLGVANMVLGRFAEASRHYTRMIDLFRELGNDEARAHGHLNYATAFSRQGRHEEALEQAELSLDLFCAIGHESGQAKSLNTVGWLQNLLAQPEAARASCRRAIAIARRLGDRMGEALTWDSLGSAHHRLGNHRQAITCYRRSINLFRDLGDPQRQISVLDHLGDAHLASGDAKAAWDAWREAVDLTDQAIHPEAENILAKLQRVNDQPQKQPA